MAITAVAQAVVFVQVIGPAPGILTTPWQSRWCYVFHRPWGARPAPSSQPFLHNPGGSGRICPNALKLIVRLQNDLAEMLVQPRLFAKESFTWWVPTPDENNSPAGFIMRGGVP